MKKILFLLITILSLQSTAQTDTIDMQRLTTDSVYYKRTIDSLQNVRRVNDSLREQKRMDDNINSLLRIQKENRAKERKGAITRIVIGVGMLLVLVIAFMRRRSKKK